MPSIEPGDIVRVTTQDPDPVTGLPVAGTGFMTDAGILIDPTTVTLRWRVAGGTETIWVYGTDSQVVKDSTGIYHADIPVVVRGLHYFRWVGTGALVAANESTFSATSNFLGAP